jgi:hypothetical protein
LKNIHKKIIIQVSVREDAEEGFEFLTLVANDLDGSSPNNDVVYRVTSGAKDKFVVDPDSGFRSLVSPVSMFEFPNVEKYYKRRITSCESPSGVS